MHSKVIIASLICLLAANFGNGKTANIVQNTGPTIETKSASCIPNQNPVLMWSSEDCVGNDTLFTAYFNIYGSDELADSLEVISDSAYMFEEFFYYPNGRKAVRLWSPVSNGDYFISFGVGDEVMVTLYAYVKGTSVGISTLSKFDARSKLFMETVATSTQRDLLASDGTGLSSQEKKDKFIAERTYNNFVYANSNDEYKITNYTTGNGNTTTLVRVRMQWYGGNGYGGSHPVNGFNVGLFINGTRVNGDNAVTDSDGSYTYVLSQSQMGNYSALDLAAQVSASNNAIKVKDASQVTYNYIGYGTRGNAIKYFSYIQIDLFAFSGYSDRGNAFQIAQAETVPYNYFKKYGRALSSPVKAIYPADYTEYVSGEETINIREEYYNIWDALNHEYAHYISDRLSLCYLYYGGRLEHNIDENLAHYYGVDSGKKHAYAEGLATYIAIASQMDSGITFVPGVGDYYYSDPVAGVSVDYSQPASGINHNRESNQAIEKSVTSVMLKMMDNVNRSYDTVAIGHQGMINLICSFNYYNEKDFNGFITRAVNYSNASSSSIYTLINQEFYGSKTFHYQSITTNSTADSSWTIRFAEGSGITLCSNADCIRLTFTGEDGDSYTVSNISLPRTSYQLSRSLVSTLMALSGVQLRVSAVAYRSNGTYSYNVGDILTINKAGAYEVLSHWNTSISMPSSRRYQWICVRSVKSATYNQQIILQGTGWHGQVAEVFDHIVPDNVTSTTKIYANSNGTVPTITKTLSYHQRVYVRVDMNARNEHYLSVQTYD